MIVSGRLSIFRVLGWQIRSVLLFSISATIVWVLHGPLGYSWLRMPAIPVAVVGGALGIFVSFRTNAAYARWWEGRQLWGRLVNNSRAFVSQVLAYLPAGTDGEISPLQRRLVERQILFTHVLRCVLREQDPWTDVDVKRFSTDELREKLARESNPMHAILHEQQVAVAREADAGRLTEIRLESFDRTFAALLDVQGGCERIKRTPMPRGYSFFAEQLTRAYGVLFPLAIVADLKYAIIPINVLVCIAFVMISEVGRVLEDPFTMFWNGLPLAALARIIENNLRQRLGDRDLEPMLQPNEQGVLM